MTKPSRRQRIALAMYRRTLPITGVQWSDEPPYISIYPKCGCYEAMDEPDVTDVAPRVITGGNYGMPCA